MAEDNKLNLTLIVQLSHKGKVIAHEEAVANETLLELKEGPMMLEDAFSKVIFKAVPKAVTKFKEIQDAERS